MFLSSIFIAVKCSVVYINHNLSIPLLVDIGAVSRWRMVQAELRRTFLPVTLGGSGHSSVWSVRTYRWTCWLRGYGCDQLRKLCQAALPGGYTNSLLPKVSELEELKAFF